MSDQDARVSSALKDRYRLERQVGAGGMAIVYLAEDLKHHRAVAVKVLRPELAAAVGPERFLREIQIVAGLRHPNILPLYDSGEAEGFVYYTMPYIAGESLRARLAREQQLPIEDALRIAREIADTLAYAHSRSIVHRDIKPENVLLDFGHAVISDFGIAHAVSIAAGDRLTHTGVLVGTPAYMSPEQAAGERSLDGRTDVYSLGAVLYEMLAGEPPHSAPTVAAVLAKRMHEPLARVSTLRDTVTGDVERVVEKALARAPADRYGSAADFGRALAAAVLGGGQPPARTALPVRRWLAWVGGAALLALSAASYLVLAGRGSRGAEPIAVAVLPFRGLALPGALRFLGIGVPDAIITRLSGLGDVRVRPTSAILRYEDAAGSAVEAGRALAADYVVAGTLQQVGEQFRITTQLVRVSDGTSVWGQRYDVGRTDLLTLQDSVAGQVAAALGLRLSAAERERLYRRYRADAVSFELYLEGRARLLRQTAADTRGAIAAFDRAAQRHPDYALAHAGLAVASAQMRIRFAPEGEVVAWGERAEREARRALELDPQLAEVREALASVARYTEFDWPRTIAESDRALELNPSLELPHYYRAAAFYHLGLLNRVDGEVRVGMANNPQSGSEPYRLLGVGALLRGSYREAIGHLEQVRRLSARAVSDPYLAAAYYYAGETDRAVAMLDSLKGAPAQASTRARALLASFRAAQGDRRAADSLLALVTGGGYEDHHVAYSVGAAYAQLGDRGRAGSWLTRAAQTGFPCYPWYEKDPLLAPLHADPEFRILLTRLRDARNAAAARYR